MNGVLESETGDCTRNSADDPDALLLVLLLKCRVWVRSVSCRF